MIIFLLGRSRKKTSVKLILFMSETTADFHLCELIRRPFAFLAFFSFQERLRCKKRRKRWMGVAEKKNLVVVRDI